MIQTISNGSSEQTINGLDHFEGPLSFSSLKMVPRLHDFQIVGRPYNSYWYAPKLSTEILGYTAYKLLQGSLY